MPSSAIGSYGRIVGTASAAVSMSGNPRTTRVRSLTTGASSSSARNTVTRVDSLPTSSPATSKPCSGSSESRL